MKLFRPARPRSHVANVARTLAQTLCFWTALLWLVPAFLVRLESAFGVPGFDPRPALGAFVLAVASVGGLWSGLTMARRGEGTPLPLDTARKLVVSGPYRWVRNPMAVTGLSQGAGVGLILGSWVVLLYVLIGAMLWHTLVRPVEEADLLARFGADYRDYRRRVGLWLPRAPRRLLPKAPG